MEVRLLSQRVKGIINLQPWHVDIVFREGPFESSECLLLLAKGGMDHREQVRGNVTLFGPLAQLVQHPFCISRPPKNGVGPCQPRQTARLLTGQDYCSL